jgi:uncharacterized protein YutE (UPF0331/DUF86 family)
MLNKDFVYRKISLMQDDLTKLSELAKFSFSEIVEDFYKQNTLERLLEKIIIRAVDINQHLLLELATKDTNAPKNYKETFTELAKINVYPKEFSENISKSVGTRNILVHEYDDEEVNYNKIYDSVSDCLKDYHQYCNYILKFIENIDS